MGRYPLPPDQPWKHYILHKRDEYILTEVYFTERGKYDGHVETEHADYSPHQLPVKARVVTPDQIAKLRRR